MPSRQGLAPSDDMVFGIIMPGKGGDGARYSGGRRGGIGR